MRLACAASRTSIGSTQSLRSICRMRCSAVIGSANTARSMRVYSRELDEIVDIAELGEALDGHRRARVAAVVEYAEQFEFRGIGLGEVADQVAREIAAADDDDPLLEPPGGGQPVDDMGEREARDRQHVEAEEKPAAEPETRDHAVELGEEHQRDQRGEGDGPGAAHAEQLIDRPPQSRDAVAMQQMESEDVEEAPRPSSAE